MEGSLDGGGLAGCLQALGWRLAWMVGWSRCLAGGGKMEGGGGLDKRLDGGEGVDGGCLAGWRAGDAWLDGGGLGWMELDGGGPGSGGRMERAWLDGWRLAGWWLDGGVWMEGALAGWRCVWMEGV